MVGVQSVDLQHQKLGFASSLQYVDRFIQQKHFGLSLEKTVVQWDHNKVNRSTEAIVEFSNIQPRP